MISKKENLNSIGKNKKILLKLKLRKWNILTKPKWQKRKQNVAEKSGSDTYETEIPELLLTALHNIYSFSPDG